MKTPKPLSDRQERFIHEYLLDQNASAAAGRAGYAPKSCGTQAVDLMKNPLIKARIAQELADLYARLKVNALDMLKSQVAAAYFDPAKLFDSTGEPLPLHELDTETKSALTINYEKRRNGEHVLRVRQTPRHVALAALWKRYDAFEKMSAEVERQVQRALEQQALAREEKESTPPVPATRKAAPGVPPALDLERQPLLVPTSMPMQEADAEIASAAEAIAASASALKTPDGASVPASLQVPAPADLAQATSGETPKTQATPTPEEAPYDFRKDPNWMWGGKLKPTPEPEPNPLVLQAMANAKWQEQNAELQGKHLKIRPGGVVAVTPMEPGYNPPWLRDNRPRFAEGAGEFEWS